MMKLEEIYKPISKELLKLKSEVKSQVQKIDNKQSIIKKALNHFFDNEGKYLRPALVLLSAKSVNGHNRKLNYKLISLAASVELIHNASLIHDDIVDNEEQRRGVLSLNKKFSSGIAMLIGDMVYTRAFLLLIKKVDKRILKIITECIQKMCLGEIEELEKSDFCLKRYLKIIELKTASLMATCCEIGAILGGGDKKSIEILRNYGLNFGFAFQLIDDYKDNSLLKCNSKINESRLLKLAKKYADESKKFAKKIPNPIIKENFCRLTDYITARN